MRILTENLRVALAVAVYSTHEVEKRANGPDFKSGLVRGWEEVLEAIDKGEPIEVRDE